MTKIQHTRRGRPAAIAESDEKQVIKDYRKLGSVKAVAEKWSVSYPAIRRVLLKHDVEISGVPVSPVENHPLLGTGSDGDVAKALGVSKATVMRARVKAGIKPFQYVRAKDRQP
jgi:hypothetical protein